MQKIGAIFIAVPPKMEHAGGTFSEAHSSPPVSAVSQHPTLLTQLNDRFLDAHKSASIVALQAIQTVIVFKCGTLSLWKNEEGQFKQLDVQSISPHDYHLLKSACHLPIIIIDMIRAGHANAAALSDLQKKLRESLKNLPTLGLRLPNRLNVFLITYQSIACITQLLQCPTMALDDLKVRSILKKYKGSIDKAIKMLSQEATKKQLSSLHHVTQQWITDHEIDLSKNRVLLVAPHGPRKGFIEMQYFINLYSSQSLECAAPIKNNYVYYVEMLGSQMGDVDIKTRLIEEFLSREEQNKTVAGWLLDDPLGMQQDILRSQAPGIIDALFAPVEEGKRTLAR